MTAAVSVRAEERVLHLVLDAPERRNALSREMLVSLADELSVLDPDILGVVISGRGEAFSAGADFAELTGTREDLGYDEVVSAAREAIISCPRLVVAAIEGPCLGAAADLALACDARVAGDGGYLQIPAVHLGLLYNPEVVARTAFSYGHDLARRLFLLGERFPAQLAAAAGLVTQTCASGEAVGRAHDLVADTRPSSLAAAAATKALLGSLPPASQVASSWQSLRLELLDSPARRAAIAHAHSQHA